MALLVLVGGGAIVAKQAYDQAMSVRHHLETAIGSAGEVKASILSGDVANAGSASDRFAAETSAAVASAQGWRWQIAEAVPFAGQNFAALRTVAEVAQQLSTEIVAPASSISVDAFRPSGGRLDVAALSELSPLLNQVTSGLDDALDKLASVDSAALLPPVAAGVSRLETELTDMRPLLAPLRDILSVLPAALGAEGPRDYLLMFQGTSEARSLGGNAAVFMVLRADQGALSIVEHITSQDFHNAPPDPILELDPQAEAIFGDKIGRFTADFTMVPDYSDAVEILRAWWDREGFPPFDAVLSLDPVALSYVLSATGPVTLPTGDVLSSDNAVALLLNEVYFRYEDPLAQNAFFTAAADSVFSAVTTGNFAPAALMSSLAKASDEGRLLYLSNSEAEMNLITPLRASGEMPADSAEQTTVGVFVNDNTGSKMSYYLDMAISTCVADHAIIGTVTLDSSVTEEEAARLPRYIAGPYFTPGDISTYVVLYGPAGSVISDVAIDGVPAGVLSAGEHLGRPAVKVEFTHHLVSSHTLSFTFKTTETVNTVQVWHTPMTRETPVINKAAC